MSSFQKIWCLLLLARSGFKVMRTHGKNWVKLYFV